MYIDWNNTYMARKRRAERVRYEATMAYKIGQIVAGIAYTLAIFSTACVYVALLIATMLIAQSYR